MYVNPTLVEDVKVTPQLANIIAILWRDSGVLEAFNYANENHLSDCAAYFLSNIKRLACSGYVPSTQDILHTRVNTCGVVEVRTPGVWTIDCRTFDHWTLDRRRFTT